MNEQDLRDCFAMFALMGIIFKIPLEEADVQERRDEYGKAARGAYDYADAMLEARDPQISAGLPPIKRRRSKNATGTD